MTNDNIYIITIINILNEEKKTINLTKEIKKK